jgi:hypothetical protein
MTAAWQFLNTAFQKICEGTKRSYRVGSMGILVLMLGLPTPSMGADLTIQPAYTLDTAIDSVQLPACDHPRIVQAAKRHLYRNKTIAVHDASLSYPRQAKAEPRTRMGTIGRRWCRANIIAQTLPHPRTLYYIIERRQGFASIGWNVEACIAGLDPWYIYGAQCESLVH